MVLFNLGPTAPGRLFVMRPHPEHLHDPLLLQHLIDEAVLDVDPARVRARQVPDDLCLMQKIDRET